MEKQILSTNRLNYELPEIVQYYDQAEGLQKPEKAILNLLKRELPQMDMLDIGVGGGRTTHFFAPLVNSYVGVDYSRGMVQTCKEKFRDMYPNACFEVADATAMDQFESASFDFILFSFNGIDDATPEDREKILLEIKRLLRKGGWFCFSTLNLQSLPKLFRFDFSLNPIKFLKEVRKFVLLRYYNPGYQKKLSQEVGIFRENTHKYRYISHYIRPQAQLKHLEELGFRESQAYLISTGEVCTGQEVLASVTDRWIYYLAHLKA